MSKYNYSSDWIHELENYNRWILYWQQQKLLHGRLSGEDRIAEIGVGTKFTYNYLRNKNFNITSIDIDENKSPDILLNIVECDDSDLNYDAILAFNIFEHIPFDEFLSTIAKFNKAKIRKIFFSIPINRKVIFEFKLRLGRYFDKTIKIDKRRNKITAKHHHWELDYKNFTKDKLVEELEERGYGIQDSFLYNNQSYFYFERISEL